MNGLIDENPIALQPSIIKQFGFERAAILQQIHFLLHCPNSGKTIDGHKWIWNTYEDWAKQLKFWEPRTVRKWMTALEKEGLIISSQFDKIGWNRRKYYRIDYDAFNEKMGASMCHHDDASVSLDDDITMRHHDDTSNGQHDDDSCNRTEISTENTTKTSSKKSSPASPPRIDPIYEIFAVQFQQAKGMPYLNKKPDFVQLAELRKKCAATGWELTAERFSKAAKNYFESELGAYTLAHLAANFSTFFNSALDRFGKPIQKGNGYAKTGNGIDHAAIVASFKPANRIGG